MSTRLLKWGNSLGVRIPKAAAEASRVREGSVVEVTARKGEIVIRPVRKRRYRLADLLKGITAENCHGEVDWGRPVGREIW